MKNLILILNVLFLVAATALKILEVVLNVRALGILAIVSIGILLALNLTIKFMKEKKHFGYLILIAGATIVLSMLCLCVGRSGALDYVLIICALALLYAAALSKFEFNYMELIYGACVLLPMVSVAVWGGFFGYKNAILKLVSIFIISFSSMLVGKTFSSLIKSRKPSVCLDFAASAMMLISTFVFLLIKFSYVSHNAFKVFELLLVAEMILNLLSIYLVSNNQTKLIEKESFKESLSKNKWGIVAAVLVMIFATFSTATLLQHLNLVSAKISKAQFLEMVGDNLYVPIIEINTENGEAPTSKEDYVNASFQISNCENEEDNFTVEMKKKYGDEDSVGIRLRGNSTMAAKKKPFRIKFDEKKSILGMKKNKSWVLLADYYDQSYMRNFTALSLAGEFGNLDFTPNPNHVALIFNGYFQGLYLLCEQIDENSGRTDVKEDFDVNTDKEFPFLVEMDNLAHKEGETGVDNFYVSDFYPVEIKYPESDERGRTETEDKVFDYIYEYINAVFFTLKTGGTTTVSFRESPVGFTDLVDINSVIDYYLLTEIMHNPDSTYKSIYFHKTKDGKMEFGPVWDYDYSLADTFEIPYKESYIESADNIYIASKSSIFKLLIKQEIFYIAVQARWNALLPSIIKIVEELKSYKWKIDVPASIDAKIWHGETGKFQYDMQYDYVRLYLGDRLAALNEIFDKPHSEFMKLI